MNKYYLAVDIGASSGRHILAHMENGLMQLEEIYRFDNGMVEKNGHKCWDVQRLFEEIKTGMKRCKELGKIPCSMAVDTWGVDFVLLDENDMLFGDAVAYRDERTCGMDTELSHYLCMAAMYVSYSVPRFGIYIAFPPDTFITCPVIILACSLAKNKIVSAISSG